MLLNLVSEIDLNDAYMKELEQLASRFGIFNMTVVVMKTNKFQALRDTKVQLTFDVTTYRQIVSELISLAILNYASAKYENFSIAINTELAQNFYRIYSAEDHKKVAENFLRQVLQILDRYES